jgi:hypothetical protein
LTNVVNGTAFASISLSNVSSFTLCAPLCLTPERRLNPKFVHLVNQHDEVVAEHLAHRLVRHGRIGLAAHEIAKFPFDHRERGLDVAPLVVVREEFHAPREEEAERLAPRAARPAGVRFREIYRLHNWPFVEGKTRSPRYIGKLINHLIYAQLPPGVLHELRQKNPIAYPRGYRRWKHHQWLTEDLGNPHLTNQVSQTMGIMRVSEDKREFERLFNRAFPKLDQRQGVLAFPQNKD